VPFGVRLPNPTRQPSAAPVVVATPIGHCRGIAAWTKRVWTTASPRSAHSPRCPDRTHQPARHCLSRASPLAARHSALHPHTCADARPPFCPHGACIYLRVPIPPVHPPRRLFPLKVSFATDFTCFATVAHRRQSHSPAPLSHAQVTKHRCTEEQLSDP
jgi:hypothetical protein